ncbi:myb/SANT-like DNA-binding domain-containing protein 4 [Perca fluviatilis]|uniref:myb/SANT-like DNA-binding domain-containing protein 4 n=1 Tax=Perca fluviatilis TaxID=8168 RepID=UPI0019667E38|nr:myb/SANT-like DNA-binding domain-containing protein 4 [Perca fluviatilis]
MEEQRKRKENFTDIEIRKLIELYSQHRLTLTAKQSNTITNKKKQTTWRQITEAINDCSDSGCLRTESDVRKKWKDLLSKAKKDLSAKKHHPTGGGPPPKSSVYSTIIVDIFGEDSPAFIGLVGAESGGTDMEETAVSPEMDVDHSSESVICEDSMEDPVTPQSSHEHSSGAPPVKRMRRLDNLQQTLLEKEIVRVETETKKLQTEQEKLELEKQKILLEIQLLQQQINRSSSPISEEDGRSFVIL